MTRLRYLFPKIYGAIGYRTYYSFSYSALLLILGEHYKKWNFNPFNYYEFGTGEGDSLRLFLKALKKISKDLRLDINRFNIFLFDSFEGLPEYNNLKDNNPAWSKEQFKGTMEEIKRITEEYLPDITSNVKFIKGYYENSLTQELGKSIKKDPPLLLILMLIITHLQKPCLNGYILFAKMEQFFILTTSSSIWVIFPKVNIKQ